MAFLLCARRTTHSGPRHRTMRDGLLLDNNIFWRRNQPQPMPAVFRYRTGNLPEIWATRLFLTQISFEKQHAMRDHFGVSGRASSRFDTIQAVNCPVRSGPTQLVNSQACSRNRSCKSLPYKSVFPSAVEQRPYLLMNQCARALVGNTFFRKPNLMNF